MTPLLPQYRRKGEVMQVLEFIFSSFWIFCGFAFLLCAGLSGIAEIISAWRRKP